MSNAILDSGYQAITSLVECVHVKSMLSIREALEETIPYSLGQAPVGARSSKLRMGGCTEEAGSTIPVQAPTTDAKLAAREYRIGLSGESDSCDRYRTLG